MGTHQSDDRAHKRSQSDSTIIMKQHTVSEGPEKRRGTAPTIPTLLDMGTTFGQ